MTRPDRKLARQRPTLPPQRHALIAVMRRSKSGWIAIIELAGKDEVQTTTSDPTLEGVLHKAFDIMGTDMKEVTTVKLLVEGMK